MDSVKQSIKNTVNSLINEYGLDVQVAIIEYGNIDYNGLVTINGSPAKQAINNSTMCWIKTESEIDKMVDSLIAYHITGREPADIKDSYNNVDSSTPLAGMGYAGSLPYRQETNKFSMLVTISDLVEMDIIKGIIGTEGNGALLDETYYLETGKDISIREFCDIIYGITGYYPQSYIYIPSRYDVKNMYITCGDFRDDPIYQMTVEELEVNETCLTAKAVTEICFVVAGYKAAFDIAKLGVDITKYGIGMIGASGVFAFETGGATAPVSVDIAIAGSALAVAGGVVTGVVAPKVAKFATRALQQRGKDFSNLRNLGNVKTGEAIQKITQKWDNLKCVECAE
ncbi:MAG: hypothetical protein ACRCTE_14345 [Cellulosilyticaceae bacterium]